jgi:F420-non-reducing hydrogenase iron-sulfur subunit
MKKQSDNFDPRIVVFACNWCSYAAADTAGVGRMQYPPNARVIRVMCSGRENHEQSSSTILNYVKWDAEYRSGLNQEENLV